MSILAFFHALKKVLVPVLKIIGYTEFLEHLLRCLLNKTFVETILFAFSNPKHRFLSELNVFEKLIIEKIIAD